MSDLIGQTVERYQILEQLGQGGMATVYLGYDPRLDRKVAVKVIRRDTFPPTILDKILKRFEREAKALARLNHPNIVAVIDYGSHQGSPYLVMPYIPSGTLKEKLCKPIHYVDAAQILAPIARALAYAHSEEIIHRDVKPSNILITRSGEPVLTDFGIAKILEDVDGNTLTSTGMGLGTPEYMAPEQWYGKADASSDQYALGVIFYEMVTGQKPYTADTPPAVMLKQAMEPLRKPREIVPELPDEVERILIKLLAKNSRNRFTNMHSLALILDGYAKEKLSPFKFVEDITQDLEDVDLETHYDQIEEEMRNFHDLENDEIFSIPISVKNNLGNSEPISKQQVEETKSHKLEEPRDPEFEVSDPVLNEEELESSEKSSTKITSNEFNEPEQDNIVKIKDIETNEEKNEKSVVEVSGNYHAEDFQLSEIQPQQSSPNLQSEFSSEPIIDEEVSLIKSNDEEQVNDFQPALEKDLESIIDYSDDSGPKTIRNKKARMIIAGVVLVCIILSIFYFSQKKNLMGTMVIPTITSEQKLPLSMFLSEPTLEISPTLIPFTRTHMTNTPTLFFTPTIEPSPRPSPTKKLEKITSDNINLLYSIKTNFNGSSFDISSDGKLIAIASEKEIIVFDLTTELELLTFQSQYSITNVGFSHDNSMIAYAAEDGFIYLNNTITGDLVHKFESCIYCRVSFTFSHNGEFLAATYKQGDSVMIWNLSNGSQKYPIAANSYDYDSLVFSPTDDYLAAVYSYIDTSNPQYYGSTLAYPFVRFVRLWNIKTGRVILNIQSPKYGMNCFAFSPDGSMLAGGSSSQIVSIWKISNSYTLHELTRQKDVIRSVQFSPDGTLLASGSQNGSIFIWQVIDGALLTSFEDINETAAETIIFSNDGQRIFIGFDDGSIFSLQVNL